MSWNFGKKIAKAFDLAIDALETIAALTANTADDKAVDALRAINEVVMTLKRGFEGKISLDTVEDAIRDLKKSIAANDAEADGALTRRFSKT